MAVIKTIPYITGKNLRGVLINQTTGQYWNTATPNLEVWDSSQVANYGIAMTEPTTVGSANYQFSMPSAAQFVSGIYSIYVYVATGSGSPPALQLSDMANGPVTIESGIAWVASGGTLGQEMSLATYGQMILTGQVSSVTNGSSFSVTLDTPYSGSPSDFTGPPLYVTFRTGANSGSYAKILTCGTITNSPNATMALTVSPAFPSGLSTSDLVAISG